MLTTTPRTQILLVTPAGFEPAIYTLRGCRPGPLDDGAIAHDAEDYIISLEKLQIAFSRDLFVFSRPP